MRCDLITILFHAGHITDGCVKIVTQAAAYPKHSQSSITWCKAAVAYCMTSQTHTHTHTHGRHAVPPKMPWTIIMSHRNMQQYKLVNNIIICNSVYWKQLIFLFVWKYLFVSGLPKSQRSLNVVADSNHNCAPVHVVCKVLQYNSGWTINRIRQCCQPDVFAISDYQWRQVWSSLLQCSLVPWARFRSGWNYTTHLSFPQYRY